MSDPKFTAAPNAQTVNYPRNTWWVAGFCDEITRDPLERTMLDRSVLLYRTQDGKAVALENRCPHRWAPLSMGKLIGDDIQCRYHGFRFGPDGACVDIPTQDHIPAACRIYAYPVIEAQPFVWVWMGDPARICEYDPPADTSWYESGNFALYSGVMEWEANYMSLHENVLDLSHFGFLHADTFGIFDIVQAPEVVTADNTVTMRSVYPERYLAPIYTMPMGIDPKQAVKFVTEASFLSPALHEAAETIEILAPKPGQRAHFTIRVLHAVTPISMDRMRYYFVSGMEIPNHPANPEGYVRPKQHEAPPPPAFIEDKDINEAIQRMLRLDSRGADYPEISVKGDAAPIQARRKLAALMARET